ncbi:MAG: TetR/AcrR family transcriptional regulator [Actinobacteria bacterium]|nr:TetR/AcrR family transcriptional regulator [Actinomycetota bacterium]
MGPEVSVPRDEHTELPSSARALLDAAKRLLLEGGFDALRLERIAQEAGENKALIRYYFGDKAGLVAALVDDLVHDATVQLVEQSVCLPRGPERVRAQMAGVGSLLHEPAFRGLFDVLPHALRDPKLRGPIAKLYRWYRDVNLECFGGDEACAAPGEAAALAGALVAVVDGLVIQMSLDPDFGPEPSLAVIEKMVTWVLGCAE